MVINTCGNKMVTKPRMEEEIEVVSQKASILNVMARWMILIKTGGCLTPHSKMHARWIFFF